MSRTPPPSIDEAISVFSTEFHFKPRTNTKRAYVAGLRAWRESLMTIGISPKDLRVDSLEPNVVTLFYGWMLSTKQKPDKRRAQTTAPIQKSRLPPRFSPATIRLYQAALLRALDFWRTRGWITFLSAEETVLRNASGIRSNQSRDEDSGRAKLVEKDFGILMLKAASSLDPSTTKSRYKFLEILRIRTLICILASTGLRISDVCRLTRRNYDHALLENGQFTVKMKKSNAFAFPSFSPATLLAIGSYLSERRDASPFLLISHGRGPVDPDKPIEKRPGYGKALSYGTAYKIVRDIAAIAYTDSASRDFLSPHAFRHWYAQRLIDNGVRLEDVQSILGHANPSTTKKTYASDPNQDALIKAGIKLHDQMDPIIQDNS